VQTRSFSRTDPVTHARIRRVSLQWEAMTLVSYAKPENGATRSPKTNHPSSGTRNGGASRLFGKTRVPGQRSRRFAPPRILIQHAKSGSLSSIKVARCSTILACLAMTYSSTLLPVAAHWSLVLGDNRLKLREIVTNTALEV